MSSIELKKNHSDVGETDIGYNFVGQIGVSTSKELGKESDIVDKIGYDIRTGIPFTPSSATARKAATHTTSSASVCRR